jgi:hypothetical protein
MRLAHVFTDGELLFTRYARGEASATTSTE